MDGWCACHSCACAWREHLRVCECNRGLSGQGQSRARERSSTGQSRVRARSISEALPGVDASDAGIQLLEGSHVNVPAGFQTLWWASPQSRIRHMCG